MCGGMLPDFKGSQSNTSHLEKFLRFEQQRDIFYFIYKGHFKNHAVDHNKRRLCEKEKKVSLKLAPNEKFYKFIVYSQCMQYHI